MSEVRADKCGRSCCPSTEKVLVFSVAVPLTIAVLIVTGIFVYYVYSKGDNSCGLNECPRDLERVLEFTDDSIDPCDDFYSFSCGMYDDPSNFTPTESVQNTLRNDLDGIIAAPIASEDPASLAMAKSFYQSCVHIEGDEEERVASFQRLIDSLGGWPIVKGSSWRDSSFDWWRAASICAEAGLDFDWFIDLDVVENEEDNVYSLQISYPRNYIEHLEGENLEDYVKIMKDIAIFMGAPQESVSYELFEVTDFQERLYQITSDAHEIEQLRKGKPLYYTVKDLQNTMTGFNWLEFLHNTTGVSYKYDDVVNVNSMAYMVNLKHLLMRTSERFQADYIIMKLIDKFWPFLSSFIMKSYEEAERRPMNRTNSCLGDTHRRFRGVADAVYIRSTVKRQVKKEVKGLVSEIRHKLNNHLNGATWIHEEAMDFAITNITELFRFVGGPDEVFDVDRYESKLGYFGFLGTNLNIIQKITQLNQRDRRRRFERIGLPVDELNTEVVLVREHLLEYSKEKLPKVIPACFLRYEFYDSNRPGYANYGSLVTLISYKMTRAFGDLLSEYLENKNKTQWWGNSLDINSARPCYYPEDEEYYRIMTNNGTIEIGKSFADNVAMDVAYEVYQQWAERNGLERVHSKYKYDADQFFWIYSTQISCVSDSVINSDTYSYYHDRQNEFIMNSFYFAHVFNCSSNTRMNPEEKCQIL